MSRNDNENTDQEQLSSKAMDRREFIKRAAVGVGAVAAGMTVGGCGSSSSSAGSSVTRAASSIPSSKAWKFGVMGDTQWVSAAVNGVTIYDDGKNPNGTPVSIIKALHQRFIDHGVKFVVQVGDMTENASSAGTTSAGKTVNGVTTPYSYTNLNAEGTHVPFVQPLYDAGIGFFVLRGNHDAAPTTATEFKRLYPQTQDGTMNATPADAFNTPNPDADLQPFPAKKTLGSWKLGSNFNSPGALDGLSDNLDGLSYSFDFNNARFVMIDQFTPPDSLLPDGSGPYDINKTVDQQQGWINRALAGKPSGGHAFVFSHKGLITQQHIDTLFGDCPADAASAVYNGKTQKGSVGMNDFIRSLHNNQARLFFCGHDHIHNRSVVWSTDDNAKGSDGARVTHILCQSASSKFYTPNENNAAGQAPVPACTSNDTFYCNDQRQTQLSQELYTVGYYVVTVDGGNVTVDYYSAPVYPTFSSGKENQIVATPSGFNFTKRESFGYSLQGKQFLLGNGDDCTVIQDAGPSGTVAKVLSGTNGNPVADPSGRRYYNEVNTGWMPAAANTKSDILSIWGMTCLLGSEQTDEYVLSLSYDKSSSPVLATPDGSGNWINAVDQNLGGAKSFVKGPWKAGYALGSYGIDAASGTVWAVINYNGYFAAVAGV